METSLLFRHKLMRMLLGTPFPAACSIIGWASPKWIRITVPNWCTRQWIAFCIQDIKLHVQQLKKARVCFLKQTGAAKPLFILKLALTWTRGQVAASLQSISFSRKALRQAKQEIAMDNLFLNAWKWSARTHAGFSGKAASILVSATVLKVLSFIMPVEKSSKNIRSNWWIKEGAICESGWLHQCDFCASNCTQRQQDYHRDIALLWYWC